MSENEILCKVVIRDLNKDKIVFIQWIYSNSVEDLYAEIYSIAENKFMERISGFNHFIYEFNVMKFGDKKNFAESWDAVMYYSKEDQTIPVTMEGIANE